MWWWGLPYLGTEQCPRDRKSYGETCLALLLSMSGQFVTGLGRGHVVLRDCPPLLALGKSACVARTLCVLGVKGMMLLRRG
jgi:hypothetical protein